MSTMKKDKLLENLIVAIAVAALGALAALAVHFDEARASALERDALVNLAGKSVAVKVADVPFPDFQRVYRLEVKGKKHYGAVAAVGSPRSRVLIAFLLSPKGEVEVVKPLAAVGDMPPYGKEDFLASLLGKADGLSAEVVSAHRGLAAGCGWSPFEATETLSRLSATVRSVHKE